ncbi:MAG: hypothetical protein K5852_00655 [Eubacterium sp.]|nr:hypothetical protein [Eubacterium sp.]
MDPEFQKKCCLSRPAAVLTAAVFLFIFPAGTAHADVRASGHIGAIFGILRDLTDLYIRMAYGAMILVFAVGTVKSGLGAQAARTFGLPGKVSSEIVNFTLGIVVFVFGILSYPIAEKIINSIVSSAGTGGMTGLPLDL